MNIFAEKPIRVYLRSSAVALALLASGCADLRWHREGADEAQLDRDFEECRQLARVQAAREAWPLGGAAPRIIDIDAQGRAVMSSPGRIESDRFLAEHDLAGSCMRKRGYQLVPKNP